MMIMFASLECFYTAHLLTDLQKPDQGTYTEVADAIMGQGFSNYGVRPFQLLNFFPTAAVMILVGGTSMFTLDGLDGNQTLDQTAWIAIVSYLYETEDNLYLACLLVIKRHFFSSMPTIFVVTTFVLYFSLKTVFF